MLRLPEGVYLPTRSRKKNAKTLGDKREPSPWGLEKCQEVPSFFMTSLITEIGRASWGLGAEFSL